MAKILLCALEVEARTFYLFNNIFDQVFAIVLATFYIFFVSSRETKFFIFVVGLIWLIFSIAILIAYIVDDSFTTIYHKRYFQIRTFLSLILLVLFASSILGLLLEGLEIIRVFTSISFLFGMFLLILVFFWSIKMVRMIKSLRDREKELLAENQHRERPLVVGKKGGEADQIGTIDLEGKSSGVDSDNIKI